MKVIKSALYDQFHCLAGNCPDSCCRQWDIVVDEETAARYFSAAGSFGDQLKHLLKKDEGEWIISQENGRCPMWQEDGLCKIQVRCGHDALCRTCREYPRLSHDYGTFTEYQLELSCPEAARMILTSPRLPNVESDTPGGSTPDYDPEIMEILLSSRTQVLKLLYEHSIPHGLVLCLMYACHVQSLIDGVDTAPFDASAALHTAKHFAHTFDAEEMLQFFSGLDILTSQWKSRLLSPAPVSWEEAHRALARYGIERYWLQAVSDFDLVSRVKMILISCLLVKTLGGPVIETAQLYSKEVENSAENMDAVLDAAYTVRVFTDDRLLGGLFA